MRSTEQGKSDIELNWQDSEDWGVYEFSNVPADVLEKIQDAVWELAKPYLSRTNHSPTPAERARLDKLSN